MEDILDVYKRPYDPKRPLVCMDELSKQTIQETRKRIPLARGRAEKYDYEYERNGVSNIFLYVEPHRGQFVTKVTDRRTKIDWAHTVQELVDAHYPDAEKIVLVLDNLNTHVGASLYETFPPAEAKRLLDKLETHYTPKHGSWLNIAEIGLSMLSRQRLDRHIADQALLAHEVSAWTERVNHSQKTIRWQFTADKARIKLHHLYPSIGC